MTKKIYRTAMGRTVDLGALQLQNENVRAVGNMGVNARGDRIDGQNQTIESRAAQVTKQYHKQSQISTDVPVTSSRKTKKEKVVSKAPPAEPVHQEPPAVADPVVDPVPETEPTPEPVIGLAAAIAKARQIKQEPIKTPRQLAQETQGVKKI